MQELIRRRRQAGFVGRRSEINEFLGNFAADDDQRLFLFSVYGDSGVGKTLLTEQFQRVARHEAGALTARADETSDGALTLLWLDRPAEAHAALRRATEEWSRHAPYAQELADRIFQVLQRHFRHNEEVLRDACYYAPVVIPHVDRWQGIRQFAIPFLRRSSPLLVRDGLRLLRYARTAVRDHPDTGPLESSTITSLADEVIVQLPQLGADESG
nr:ATP-binding protein [Streptomyces sp. SBE_14.2]